jgi:hypothetical protein
MINFFTTVIIVMVTMFISFTWITKVIRCRGYTNMPEVFCSADIS